MNFNEIRHVSLNIRPNNNNLSIILTEYGNRMGCLTTDMNHAEMCVSLLTSPIASHIHKAFQLNSTSNVGDENSLRACLYVQF